jgi:predicted dehydrogenase
MLKLGIIGLSPGNGHPYSWSAIFNGYDREKMAECPFIVIPEYLNKQDPETMRIPGAKVTHIWTQDRKISEHVAEASLIENVIDDITGLIGKVDAVLLARDDGKNHLETARPFIEKGIPILIDKPLADNYGDLKEFVKYYRAGKPLMSCSSMRFSEEILRIKRNREAGEIVHAFAVSPKLWRTYGIHMAESVCAVMGYEIESVQNAGAAGAETVIMRYMDGRSAVIETFKSINQGAQVFFGEEKAVIPEVPDSFQQFKSMLKGFMKMLDTGKPPFAWMETVKTTKVIIAGRISLAEGGREVYLKELKV